MQAATDEDGDMKHLPIKGELQPTTEPEDYRSEAKKTMRDQVIAAITNPDLIEVMLCLPLAARLQSVTRSQTCSVGSLSPYQLTCFNLNSLKHLLEEVVDFQRIRRQTIVKLFLGATNVRSCKLKVRIGRELTADHVLASSCLPFRMHAVEIDGERHQDSGFIGNPALFQ
jgi:hypothetical protein